MTRREVDIGIVTTYDGSGVNRADAAMDRLTRAIKQSNVAARASSASFGAAARGAELFGMTAEGAVQALFDFGRAVADTIRNIDELEKSMSTATRGTMAEQIEQIKRSEKQLKRLDEQWNRFLVTVAASDFAAEAIGAMRHSVEKLNDNIEISGGLWGTLDWLMTKNISTVDIQINRMLALKDAAREAALAARMASFGFTGEGPLMPEAKVGVPAAIAAPTGQESGPSPAERRAAAQERARKAAEAEAEAQRKRAEALNAVNVTFTERLDVQGTVMQQEQIASAQEQANVEMTKQLRRESTMAMMEDASFAMGVIGDSAAMVGDFVVEAIKRSGSESKRALKQAAVASKAFAIMDIALKTAQSVMSSAAIGFPQAIPGVIAATALGAVQIATVAATPLPSFHTGGRRGADEQMAPPAIIRRGEVPAIITEQGFRNIGGDRGLAAINRGDTGGGTQPIYLVLEGVTAPLRELARPEPALGQT